MRYRALSPVAGVGELIMPVDGSADEGLTRPFVVTTGKESSATETVQIIKDISTLSPVGGRTKSKPPTLGTNHPMPGRRGRLARSI